MLTRHFLHSLLIEFGPITLFFLIAEWRGFFAGTIGLIIATILAVVASYLRDRRLPLFSLLSSLFVLIFGGLTLYFWEPRWLVLEYTLYNGIAGLALLAGLFWGKAFLKPLFETMFAITERGWRILSFRWALFFLATALGNEIVWGVYGEPGWIIYRFAAALVLCMFGFSQFPIARQERLPEASPWGLRM